MSIAPQNLYLRLETIYQLEPLAAAERLKQLIVETVELVELHLPEINTSKARQSIERQPYTWTPTTDRSSIN